MTIGEYLQKQARAVRTAKWVTGGLAVILCCIAVVAKAPKYSGWVIGIFVSAVGFALLIGPHRRMKCPYCNAYLQSGVDTKGELIPRCPKCGGDFNQPMPQGPTNPIG
jgi:hypothetical protein